MKPRRSDSTSEVDQIRAKLGHLTMQWEPTAWLDTGSPDVNDVLGSQAHGIPYGRIMEVYGMESNGKTALALSLCALAQQDGATIHWGDFESSFDPEWAAKRGLDASKVRVFQPYVGKFEGEKEMRLSTAQELCQEIEASVASRKTNKQIIVVDSVTSMLVEGEATAGLTGRNLRSSMSHPVFLGALLRRWVGLSQSYSALIILINQLRQNPMQMFGSPWYTPGGNAPRFYSHVRVKLHRVKGGKMMHGGKMIGVKGIITCVKNKVGGTEGAEIGYKMLFDGPIQFLSVKDLKKESGESED